MSIFGYTRPRIALLYVEDDPVTRNILGRMIPMKFPDIEFFAAENGEEGLALYREKEPDIVVTDINMPVMDGIRMATEIKARRPETIIIVVSAYSDTNYLLDAIEIGVNHYFMKPIDYKKLFVTIAKCMTGIIMEARLKDQNEHIRKLSRAVEQSPSMAMITDNRGIIEYVNPKFSEVTGYEACEVIGQTPQMFNSGMTSPETYRELWGTITGGEVWRGEFLNRKKNGELYWESSSISPVFDENGVITHFVAVKEDITLRKRAEEEIRELNLRLEARARELEAAKENLEAVNRELEAFNYTVSHDLKKPLTNINGFCQVILHLHADHLNEQSRRYLEEIYSATLRMNRLIDTLLDFSRLSRREMVRKRIDLSAMAAEVLAELTLGAPQRQVSCKIAEGITAYGDSGLVRVVLENLFGNAWKYSAEKKKAIIEFGVINHEGKPVHFVRDNGAGFDMSQADRLFTPFHRLHSEQTQTGHGIGLATVQRIIQRHGGRVWAEAKPKEGATFYFTLPEPS